MIFYLILIGREQNNLSKFKNLKLVKIYLITDNKIELKKRLLKEIKTQKRRLKEGLIHLTKM